MKHKLLDMALVLMVGTILTCTSDTPTEPILGGTEDKEDRDEIIYTRSDPAYLTQDGSHVFTKNFLGNPEDKIISIPIYAIVLYNDRNELVRMAFGGIYEIIGQDDLGYKERDNINPHEYLQPLARVKFDDIDYRPIYYLNVYAWGYEQAKVEKIIKAHFVRLAMGKTLNKGCLLR